MHISACTYRRETISSWVTRAPALSHHLHVDQILLSDVQIFLDLTDSSVGFGVVVLDCDQQRTIKVVTKLTVRMLVVLSSTT
jgi:hypothetical protein